GIRDLIVTGVQTCALPICRGPRSHERPGRPRGDGRGGVEMIAVALRGLAGRKLRAALTALAIVLGVAMVSGTYVFTDTTERATRSEERRVGKEWRCRGAAE